MKNTNRFDKKSKAPEHIAFQKLAKQQGWDRHKVGEMLKTNANYAQEILWLSVFPPERMLVIMRSVIATHQVL